MPEVPPWLNIGPRDFAAAKEAGMKLQLERQQLAQSAQQAAAQIGMEGQRLAAQERQAAREAQIRQEQIKSNALRSQTQIAVAKAYHDATLGLQKNRLDLEGAKLQQTIQDRAASLADRQGYAMDVASGMKAAEALARHPRAWEPGMASGMSKAGPEETFARRTLIPATQGTPAVPASKGYFGGHLFGLGAHPATPATPDIPQQTLTETVKAPPGTSAADAFAAGSAGGSPAATESGGTQDGLPQPDQVVNGYKYNGGDPTDQNSWEEVEQ